MSSNTDAAIRELAQQEYKWGFVTDIGEVIAGIVLAQHATLATRNTAPFEDISVPLINPWSA